MRFGILLAAFAVAVAVAPTASAQDPARGQRLFEQCAACHLPRQESAADGPSLVGVLGRSAGTLADFRFSRSMSRAGWVWDEARLDAYLADPQAVVPGTRMAFAGLADKADRADVIAYLKALR